LEIAMRMLLIASIPVEIGNAGVRDASLPGKLKEILDEQKPESVYLSINDDGARTAFVVVNMEKSSDLAKFAEPWFQTFNAAVTLRPCMTPDDLGLELT
jgi:hypothetical protein